MMNPITKWLWSAGRIFAIALCTTFALAATPSHAALAPGDHQFTIQFEGETRKYDVHVPPGYAGTTVSLVLDFHFFGGTKEEQKALSGWDDVSDKEGFIVAYPQAAGLIAIWEVEDVGLAVALIDAIAAKTPIDRKRVYATGYSNGGYLTHLIGCVAADYFAAIVPVAYGLPVENLEDCNPSRPMPVLHFHGLLDDIVEFNGGLIGERSIPESFLAWAMINECQGDPFVLIDGPNTFCVGFAGPKEGSISLLCVLNTGHNAYNNPDGLDIAEAGWSFLSSYSLP